MVKVWLFSEDGRTRRITLVARTLDVDSFYDKENDSSFCPCHRGRFDVKTGAVLDGPPPRPLDELEVEIRDSAVYVKYKEYRLGVPARIEA